jgi:hypothetical protein
MIQTRTARKRIRAARATLFSRYRLTAWCDADACCAAACCAAADYAADGSYAL